MIKPETRRIINFVVLLQSLLNYNAHVMKGFKKTRWVLIAREATELAGKGLPFKSEKRAKLDIGISDMSVRPNISSSNTY